MIPYHTFLDLIIFEKPSSELPISKKKERTWRIQPPFYSLTISMLDIQQIPIAGVSSLCWCIPAIVAAIWKIPERCIAHSFTNRMHVQGPTSAFWDEKNMSLKRLSGRDDEERILWDSFTKCKMLISLQCGLGFQRWSDIRWPPYSDSVQVVSTLLAS